MLNCKVCGKQYVGSTFMLYRVRFNNYRSSSKKVSNGISDMQAELSKHFTEANHNRL